MTTRRSNLRSITITPTRSTITQTNRTVVFNNRSSLQTTYVGKTNTQYAEMHLTRTRAGDPNWSFTFPFTPAQIQYSNLSPELSELSRPGKMPLVAFSNFRSRQIAIKFLVAVPMDGMFTTVDDDILLLFDMANTARPVFFTNMDKQISNPLGQTDASKNIFWSITDMNLSSIRRNEDNQITAAEVNLTLVENTNKAVIVGSLPPISYAENVPPPTRSTSPSSPTRDLLDYTDRRGY